MKPKHHISLAVLLAIFMLSCGGSPGVDTQGYKITTAVSPDSMAASMAAALSPESAAEALVGWLQEASLSDGPYARSLASALISAYPPEDGKRFSDVVDSLQRTLPAAGQAHVLAVASRPEALASALWRDTPDTALHTLIAAEYSADSLLSARFGRAMSSQRLRRRPPVE